MNEQECAEYYYNTGKVPPVNLVSWVPAFSIITSAGWSDDLNNCSKTTSN